jgi:hypothetical protein
MISRNPVREARLDGAGFEAVSQNRRRQSDAGGAIEALDGPDSGLNGRTFADGPSAHGGNLSERAVISTMAGTGTFLTPFPFRRNWGHCTILKNKGEAAAVSMFSRAVPTKLTKRRVGF